MRSSLVALLCVALVLLGELTPRAAAFRIPLRKMAGAGRSVRAEVPQPLTLSSQGYVMDILLGTRAGHAASMHC